MGAEAAASDPGTPRRPAKKPFNQERWLLEKGADSGIMEIMELPFSFFPPDNLILQSSCETIQQKAPEKTQKSAGLEIDDA